MKDADGSYIITRQTSLHAVPAVPRCILPVCCWQYLVNESQTHTLNTLIQLSCIRTVSRRPQWRLCVNFHGFTPVVYWLPFTIQSITDNSHLPPPRSPHQPRQSYT